jgi:pyridoxamine 5'-phosphate oxidase family protein
MTKEINSLDFKKKELTLLKKQRLGRLATDSSTMQSHVVPVAFMFDGRYIYLGGWNLKNSLKFKNILQNNKVAFIVDDLISIKSWSPRGVEIRGIAEILHGNDYVKIVPQKK